MSTAVQRRANLAVQNVYQQYLFSPERAGARQGRPSNANVAPSYALRITHHVIRPNRAYCADFLTGA